MSNTSENDKKRTVSCAPPTWPEMKNGFLAAYRIIVRNGAPHDPKSEDMADLVGLFEKLEKTENVDEKTRLCIKKGFLG